MSPYIDIIDITDANTKEYVLSPSILKNSACNPGGDVDSGGGSPYGPLECSESDKCISCDNGKKCWIGDKITFNYRDINNTPVSYDAISTSYEGVPLNTCKNSNTGQTNTCSILLGGFKTPCKDLTWQPAPMNLGVSIFYAALITFEY